MQKAIIIGAGPAGLTAAYELLQQTEITPIIYEATDGVGGIARTYNYKGNRLDIGGHRFFSKSDRVMEWWLKILPLQGQPARDDRILGAPKPFSQAPDAPDPEQTDQVMLLRTRLSRIFYLGKFFSYPIALNWQTAANLGVRRMLKIGGSYAQARLFPIRPETSLEHFMINRFGQELYATFFRDYTEKVWGVPPAQIKPDWGTQRIKGVSISKVLWHALAQIVKSRNNRQDGVSQKQTETSLIEQFWYPKYGPGHLWERVAELIRARGGQICFNLKVIGVTTNGPQVVSVTLRDETTGQTQTVTGDYFLSTMPVRELIAGMDQVPDEVRNVARGLIYRNFITVGVLLRQLKIKNDTPYRTLNGLIPDSWIYVQEPHLKLGRLQIFNNWSPYLVKDAQTVWIGLEYFCSDGDALWTMPEEQFKAFAIAELAQMGMIDKTDVLDATVLKVPQAYPAYFGSYDEFATIQTFLDAFPNLFLLGRNGMHRYNNMDHSMLTAMRAVENIRNGVTSKDTLWAINTEEEYHEASDRK